MQVGVVFPQTEFGPDPAAIAEYAATAEAAGFDHLLAFDHVLAPAADGGDDGAFYDVGDPFHEPLTLFAHLAGATDDLNLVTGVLVLPQRETALVAKQAAQVDVLSGGRLRLGVAVGWHEAEYAALGADFGTRGRRIEEQIRLLRELWTEPSVRFDGEFHTVEDLGLNPRPVQRPIPVRLGGSAEPVLRRVGRLADGWLPQFDPDDEAAARVERVRGYAREAGRDPDELTLHCFMHADPGEEPAWRTELAAWEDFGADAVSVSAMGNGLTPAEHVRHLEAVADEMGL